MNPVAKTLLATLAAFALLGAAPAGPVESAPGPKNTQGLTATIVVSTDTYTLDASQTGQAFRDKIAASKGPRAGALPKPPLVDLTLRITNSTDTDVTINVGGDDSQLQLKLAGPGAITADNMVAMTMEFRIGTPVKIRAGASYDVPIKSLAFGMRGISQYAYWTEPGDYTLTATLLYPIGEKQTTVTSGPAKLKVEADKAGK